MTDAVLTLQQALSKLDFGAASAIVGPGSALRILGAADPLAATAAANRAFREAVGFAHGGIVPGPIGSPRVAVVHGGEEVLTPGQQRSFTMGDMVFNFAEGTSAADADAIADRIAEKVNDVLGQMSVADEQSRGS